MAATRTGQVFLPRRGTLVSSIKSQHVVRSTTADTWRWLWPDVLMRILPLGLIPFAYIAIFHLPPAFLGLTLGNVPHQLFLVLGGVSLMQLSPRFTACMLSVPGFAGPRGVIIYCKDSITCS